MIRFLLTEPIYCEGCSADAEVISRPPGMGQLPGEDVYGRVHVYDLIGCFLNAPNGDLVGARGYAVYLDLTDEHTAAPCAMSPGVYWQIISLCCQSDNNCMGGQG